MSASDIATKLLTVATNTERVFNTGKNDFANNIFRNITLSNSISTDTPTEIDKKLSKIYDNVEDVYDKGLIESAGEKCIFVKLNPYFPSDIGRLSSSDVTKAVREYLGRDPEHYEKIDATLVVLPNDVTNIEYASFGNPELTAVRRIIPLDRENRVKNVGAIAFGNLHKLQQLDLRNCTYLTPDFLRNTTTVYPEKLILSRNLDPSCLEAAFNVRFPPNGYIAERISNDDGVHLGSAQYYMDGDGKPLICRTCTLYAHHSNILELPDSLIYVIHVFLSTDSKGGIALPNCLYGSDLLYACEGKHISYLSLYNVNKEFSKYYNNDYTYKDNEIVDIETLVIKDSTIPKNALRDIHKVKNLTLENCSLGVNSLRSNAFDKLTLNNLKSIHSSGTFINTTAKEVEIVPGSTAAYAGVSLEYPDSVASSYYGGTGLVYTKGGNDTLVCVIPHPTKHRIRLQNKKIASNAINDIDNLDWVYITADVEAIEAPLASGSPYLRGFGVDSKNAYFKYSAGHLCNKDNTRLIRFAPRNGVYRPNLTGITRIEDYALADWHGIDGQLYDIAVPGTVTSIGDHALNNSDIGELKIPKKFEDQAIRTNCFGAKSYAYITTY